MDLISFLNSMQYYQNYKKVFFGVFLSLDPALTEKMRNFLPYFYKNSIIYNKNANKKSDLFLYGAEFGLKMLILKK